MYSNISCLNELFKIIYYTINVAFERPKFYKNTETVFKYRN